MAAPAAAQNAGINLTISGLDVSGFPDVSFHVSAIDQNNDVIEDLSGLVVREDEKSVERFAAEEIRIGLELVFVIDANNSFEQRDEPEGLSRREKVRDSIIDFAQRYMDPQLQDRVTIVVPTDGGGRVLGKAGMSFTNEVINAINFYEPGTHGATPLQAMLELALQQADSGHLEGRYPAIVLFSDAALLREQLNYTRLIDLAGKSETTFFGVILGSRADADELDNVAGLTEPTGGRIIHMPEASQATPLFESVFKHGFSHRISYHSKIDSSGLHNISVSLGSGTTESTVDLTVEPPVVQLAVDNSQPIRRVATSSDALLAEIEPTIQPLVAQVTWPDGHPRALVETTLLVDGIEWALEDTIFSNDGLLTFDWQIGSLNEGVYDLQMQVVDELGLSSMSSTVPLTIEVERPSPPVVQEVAPTPTTPAVVDEPVVTPASSEDEPNIIAFVIIAAVLLISGVTALAFVIYFLRRRRRTKPAAARVLESATPPVLGTSSGDPGDTFIMQPSFASQQGVSAYLEALENAPEHPGLIPLNGSNVALGRDPRRVQVPFKDRSVSRLHARIMMSHGSYLLYDEGSSSGTYVNYQRVGLSPRQLKDSDDLHLGRVRIRFRLATSLQAEGRL